MRRHFILLWLILFTLPAAIYAQQSLEECTVGVAAGKAAVDGRPLLWKNRDAGSKHNEVVYFKDGRFKYLALADANSLDSAWAGTNEIGFCIMNSASSDLPGKNKNGLHNGGFMKRALQQCVTADDFEKLLKETNITGRTTKANFGVIDAFGGAAFFETGHYSYTRFDATDPQAAPQGYIVRANFAMTGGGDTGRIRYDRGNQLWQEAIAQDRLDYRWVLRKAARDMADPNGICYPIPVTGAIKDYPPGTIYNRDTICRSSTVSVVLFQGVKTDENPSLTTFWVILGEPIFSIAIPCWVIAESTAPELDGPEQSPLCAAALELRNANYIERGQRRRYIKTERLNDIWALIYPVEDRIFDQTEKILYQWRRDYPSSAEVAQFHQAVTRRACRTLLRAREKLRIQIK